jgi:FkbH-like protein
LRSETRFESLLEIATLDELRAKVANAQAPFSLPQVFQLTAHAKSLGSALKPLRLAIVHTYTSHLLDPWLELASALQGLEISTYHAPYGLSLQEAQINSGLIGHAADLTLLLLQREDVHPQLAKPIVGLDSAEQAKLRDEVVERLCGIVSLFRAHDVGEILVTLLPALHSPGLGIYDTQAQHSESMWWASLKHAIGDRLRESMHATLFVDLDQALEQLGRERFFDRRFWYSARFPFSPAAALEVARRIVALGAVIKLPKLKVIALDADNTLWGGIVGEDGADGIALGPEYPGNAYVAFQRRLLDYQQRGFILALCSKNNPADVDHVIDENPHQLLRASHFAARRVNWLPKSDNLAALAEELNLGLDSFLFVDDSEHECAAVRHKYPEIEVVRTPAKPIDVPDCLEHVARLELLSMTPEDMAKTQLYAQESRRRELKQRVASAGDGLRDYLSSLNMKMRIGFNDLTQIRRLSQLTQKTNQFNLTTRRYDEHQIREFMVAEDWLVAHFSLADVFGDSGVVGLALLHTVDPRRMELDSFLMSCRVIGREAESAFMHALLRHLSAQGITEVVAYYSPTPKNDLVRQFLPSEGFVACAEDQYLFDLHEHAPRPETAFPVSIVLPSSQ